METVMAIPSQIAIPGIETIALERLKPNPSNARTHSKRQILIDKNGMIIAGHGRLTAAKRLGMTEVPALRIEHLSDDEIRAYVLADNQLATLAGWDDDILAIELQHLMDVVVDFDVTVTGFEMPVIDLIIEKAKAPKPEDEIQPIDRTGAAVTRPGDLWRVGPHRILCADALKMASYATLMGEELAKIAFADPPYNVKIAGFVSQSARLAHREFAMAVGEMTENEFIAFLRSAIGCASFRWKGLPPRSSRASTRAARRLSTPPGSPLSRPRAWAPPRSPSAWA
jgi:hypothetical protein